MDRLGPSGLIIPSRGIGPTIADGSGTNEQIIFVRAGTHAELFE